MYKLQYFAFINLLIFCSSFLFAQESPAKVKFYTTDEEPFYVYINTIQQNNTPQSEIILDDLSEETYRVRIKFDKDNILPVERSIHFKANKFTTFKLIKRRDAKDPGNANDTKGHKAKYTLKLASITPIDDDSDKDDSDETEEEEEEEKGKEDDAGEDSHSADKGDTGKDTQTEGSHSHSHQEGGHHHQEKSISIGINITESYGGHHQSPYSVPYPTEGSSSSTSTSTDSEGEEETQSYLPGYNGAIGCSPPMSSSQFRDAKSSIMDKTFEDSKMQIAKQITKSKCLLSEQVKEIMQIFSYESSRLEFAKFAYDHTYDIDNYYKVHDAFEYESSIEELNNYID